MSPARVWKMAWEGKEGVGLSDGLLVEGWGKIKHVVSWKSSDKT